MAYVLVTHTYTRTFCDTTCCTLRQSELSPTSPSLIPHACAQVSERLLVIAHCARLGLMEDQAHVQPAPTSPSRPKRSSAAALPADLVSPSLSSRSQTKRRTRNAVHDASRTQRLDTGDDDTPPASAAAAEPQLAHRRTIRTSSTAAPVPVADSSSILASKTRRNSSQGTYQSSASERSPSASLRGHSPFSTPATPATSYSTSTNVSISSIPHSKGGHRQPDAASFATLADTGADVALEHSAASPKRSSKSKGKAKEIVSAPK